MPKISGLSAFAKKKGFMSGDDVVSIDNFPMLDILDYLYYDNETKFSVEVLRGGKKHIISVKKREGEPLGLEFDIEMKPYHCKNHCKFCFVDQLPKGLRETLYVKDDDYRFSFISGSFVTLTNVTDCEIDRIIRLKLSPLYISVHALDDKIRLELVRNPNTLKLKEYMVKLGNAGIKMHTQLVVVPDINDGMVMEESIRGLHKINGVQTVAVVPVGMTKFRAKLDTLKAVDEQNALETIKIVERLHVELDGICWCSDEYYVKANRSVKHFSYYGNFDQIENGVGLLADFADNLDFALSEIKTVNLKKKIAFITGTSFAPILEKYFPAIKDKLGVECSAHGIKNNFFGEEVTVAGLVTASDIISQMKSVDADVMLMPDNMLREFTDVFLDDISLEDVKKELRVPIIVLAHNGSNAPQKIIEFFSTN